MNPRVVATSAVVIALHVALIAAVLSVRNEPVSRPVQPVTIVAELLSPAPIAAPAAIQPAPTPPDPTPPVSRAKPKVQPRPTPVAPLPVAPAPSPTPVAPAPSPTPVATPESEPPTAGPSAGTVLHAAPAGAPTLALSAPRNVSHLDCDIVKPDYPALSRRRSETGTAVVRFVLSPSGTMESIQLARSSGIRRLDDAALAAMHASSCRPYLDNGTPMRAETTQAFTFNLSD